MPILKIPLSPQVKGMILLDSKPLYTMPALKLAYKTPSEKIILPRDSVLRKNILGENYYRIGPSWPDELRQAPTALYEKSAYLEDNEYVVFNIHKDLNKVVLISIQLSIPDHIIRNRPGMFRKKGGGVITWNELYNQKGVVLYTLAGYLTSHKISNSSTVYAGIKHGSIVSMDFMGVNNALFAKL